MANRYSWQDTYEAAILETDFSRLKAKIAAAQAAIDARVDEIRSNHGGTPEEREALMDAVSGLQVLRKETSRD